MTEDKYQPDAAQSNQDKAWLDNFEYPVKDKQSVLNEIMRTLGKGWETFVMTLQKGAVISWDFLSTLQEKKVDVVAGINGLMGDILADQKSSLAICPGFYWNQEKVVLKPESIQKAYPKMTGKICILVHGLMGHEGYFSFPDEPGKDYGTLLQADLHYTPFYFRYNSGLHISENGQLLSQSIQELVENYPQPVEDIILIGHSLGGLVIRSAGYYGQKNHARWIAHLRKVFLIGSPSLGAYLEKISNLTAVILKMIINPYTKVIAEIINLRSNGIKDVRFGYLIAEDWEDQESDSLRNNRHHIPLLDNVDYYIIAGSIHSDVDHPVFRFLGDGMVSQFSATGQSFFKVGNIPFPKENYQAFPQVLHISLANHLDVYKQILSWCHS